MGLDAAWALEWLAAIGRLCALAEHNLDAIVCFDNQHANALNYATRLLNASLSSTFMLMV
jgi:hypothetical protein